MRRICAPEDDARIKSQFLQNEKTAREICIIRFHYYRCVRGNGGRGWKSAGFFFSTNESSFLNDFFFKKTVSVSHKFDMSINEYALASLINSDAIILIFILNVVTGYKYRAKPSRITCIVKRINLFIFISYKINKILSTKCFL